MYCSQPRLPPFDPELRQFASGAELFCEPRFGDCGGVKPRQPDREDSTEAEPPLRLEIVDCEEERFHQPPLLLWPLEKDDCPCTERFPKFPPPRDEEKKCCEPDGACRKDVGSAPRPAALKLPRPGERGIFPVIRLACRKDAALIPSWCEGTDLCPNSFEFMERIPERTRSFVKASCIFEKPRSPRSGPQPSRSRNPRSSKPRRASKRPPQRPHHG